MATASCKDLPCKIDTVCLHGDGAEALAMARALRGHLTEAGFEIGRFGA
ncbi:MULTISPECIES: LamB/YcsF family protein [Thioclava]|nr:MULTISPECIES: LamB/YcsF family protein [Thioclava]